MKIGIISEDKRQVWHKMVSANKIDKKKLVFRIYKNSNKSVGEKYNSLREKWTKAMYKRANMNVQHEKMSALLVITQVYLKTTMKYDF